MAVLNWQAPAALAAQREGVPVNVFLAQINQESGFNPNAVSSAGAKGIAQFMPATAAGMGIDPMNPTQALDAAAKMDAANLKKYGSLSAMLSAYNSGKPDAYLDPHFAGGQTTDYVKKILSAAGQPAAPTVGGTSIATPTVEASVSTGLSAAQKALQQATASYLLQQSNDLAAGNGASLDSTGLMQLALARNQAQQTQQTYGSTPQPTGSILAAPTATGSGSGVVKTALTQLGTPYQYGGPAELGAHTDCSGLVQAAFRANGVDLPRTTYDQWKVGTPVASSNLQPGDRLFFNMTSKGPEHTGIYVGAGQFIEDPHTGADVQLKKLSTYPGYVGARRDATATSSLKA